MVNRPTLLHHCVDAQAHRNGDAVAIEVGERRVTYAELAKLVAGMASLLRAGGVGTGARVAILADNGIEACAAILGALRADACFVPLNPDYPAPRIASIVGQAGAAAVIVTAAHVARVVDSLPLLGAVRPGVLIVPDLDRAGVAALRAAGSFANVFGSDDWAAAPDPGPSVNIPDALAYILFTSGTTGTPKGAMVSHRALMATIDWAVRYFAFGPGDRVSNHSRISFDANLFDMFGAFFGGATLLPVTRPGDRAFPGDFIRSRRITVWFSVPSIIDLMARSRQLTAGPFEHLRAALFGGEALTPAMAAAWRAAQPHTQLYNLYGPTETAINCTCHHVGVDRPFDSERPIPIGHATPGATLLVLEPEGDGPVAEGATGRLLVGGVQRGDGYWGRPDLTAAAFHPVTPGGPVFYETGDLVRRDADGCLHYVGRADSQVKIMGFRVELGDIEAALNGCPGIRESAAVLREEGGPRIVAAVVPDGGLDAEAVLAHCAAVLPAYMVPKEVVGLAELPRNLHGKVDRAALRAALEAPAP